MGLCVVFRCDVCGRLSDWTDYEQEAEHWENNPEWWVADDGSEIRCPNCAPKWTAEEVAAVHKRAKELGQKLRGKLS